MQADSLYRSVDEPTAAMLDARLVAQLSRLCRQQGEGLSTNAQAFHAVEFAGKMVHNMGGTTDPNTGNVVLPGRHWTKFGEFRYPHVQRLYYPHLVNPCHGLLVSKQVTTT